MGKSTRLMYPVEARLARLIQVSRAAERRGKMVRGALASDDPNYKMETGPVPLVPMSFRDIGMESIDELIKTFDDLDQAVRDGKKELVDKLLSRLCDYENGPHLTSVVSK